MIFASTCQLPCPLSFAAILQQVIKLFATKPSTFLCIRFPVCVFMRNFVVAKRMHSAHPTPSVLNCAPLMTTKNQLRSFSGAATASVSSSILSEAYNHTKGTQKPYAMNVSTAKSEDNRKAFSKARRAFCEKYGLDSSAVRQLGGSTTRQLDGSPLDNSIARQLDGSTAR